MEEDILVDIVNNIIESRIKSILEIINAKYPEKFDKTLIKKEYEYIKTHIVLEKAKSNECQSKKDKDKRKNIIKLKQIKPKDEMQDKMQSRIFPAKDKKFWLLLKRAKAKPERVLAEIRRTCKVLGLLDAWKPAGGFH